MLFAKRELKDALGINLSQRFAQHIIGRYLTASNDDEIRQATSLNIADCYTFLGEDPHNDGFDRDKLKRTTQQVISDYHEQTGYWLNHEQVAFAAIWQDAKQGAAILQKRFKHPNIATSTLHNNDNTSLLRIALIADSLKLTAFTKSCSHFTPIKPSSCSRILNLPLDETNMPEIEAIGREVRDSCQSAQLSQGVDIDDLQTCWRLKLRYEGSKNSLVLKCMPIEMLRETFETQHLQKYGVSDENRVIIIEELEIEIGTNDTIPDNKLQASVYIRQWMNQWHAVGENQTGLWSKHENSAIQKQFSWLFSPVLEDILNKLIVKQADSAMLGFFLTIHQKGVDEVAMRN